MTTQFGEDVRKQMAQKVHDVKLEHIAVGAIANLPEDELMELYDESVENAIAQAGECAPEFPDGGYGASLHETYLRTGGLRFNR